MRKAIILLTAGILSLSAMSLFSGDPEVIKKTSDPKTIAESNNDFMMRAYKILSEEDKNIFISPYSISSALAMTYAGSANKTETEMGKALGFGSNDTGFHTAFGTLTKTINGISKKGDLQLSIANSLWLSENYKFLDEFIKINTEFYQAETANLNFAQSEKARKTINDWVLEKTMGKIKDLIPEGILDSLTKLVLTNAVYFKAEWAEQFKKNNTKESEFYASGKSSVNVDIMNLKHHFNYMENDELQFIELPYKGNDASMYILLPKEKDGLKGIEKKLTYKDIEKYTSALERKEVNVFLPKFKMSLSYELRELMGKLGMKEAFSKKADFSKMNGNTELYISAIIHKTFIDVDETGTEAAAATAVVMRMKSAPPTDNFATFKADHPFFYFIKDKVSGTILFAGRVTDPSAK